MVLGGSVVLCLALLSVSLAGAEPNYSKIDPAKSPIQKVVIMLTEMKAQVEKEADEDLESYDKYKCWCETSEKEKTAAVAAAEASIEQLTSFIEAAAGKEGQLKTEIAGLEADIAEDQDALETATAMKEKETAEFEADEAYMKETLAALTEAVAVLSKVQLLQKAKGAEAARAEESTALVQVRNVLQRVAPKFHNVMQKDLMDLLGSMGSPAGSAAGAFLEARRAPDAVEETGQIVGGGAAAGAKSYNSRSGQIFGLLDQMKDQFTEDLASATKEEAMAMENFQKLSGAKNAEIAAATEQKKSKEAELADTMAKAAQAKEDLEATKNALSADQAFLVDMTKNCKTVDEEYAARSKVRGEEIVAIAETIGIVTSDEARDLFGKTISFVQLGSVSVAASSAEARAQMQDRAKDLAMKRIMKTAQQNKNWGLAALAVRVRLDAFTKVKAAMDKMTAELKEQQKAEYDKNEFCKKEIDETEDSIKVSNREKDDLDEKHTNLSNQLATLADEIAALKQEVFDMEVGLKQAGENRKAENLLFQQSVADQRATIKVLNMALDRLKSFYEKTELVQRKVEPPPQKPGAYEKSGSSGGVMQMIAKIITDAEVVEQDMVFAEKNSQADYVSFTADTTRSIEADRASIAGKEEETAQASSEKSSTEESQLSNDAQLEKLGQLLSARHGECDYVIKYFKIRQQARQEEMDAIAEAKGILSGADFA